MKSLTLILLFFSYNALSARYHFIYGSKAEKAELEQKAKDLDITLYDFYTRQEKSMLPAGVTANILEAESSLELSKLRKAFAGHKIELISNINLESDYSSEQWYLDNPGGSVDIWTSDIDMVSIESNTEADLNLENIPNETSRKIKVAIIDSGIDLKHFELKDQIIQNTSECTLLKEYKACLEKEEDDGPCHEQYATQDSNQNGYPLDCNGWSLTNEAYPTVSISGNPDITDPVGHGTHVAGLIGAAKNKQGINGVIKNVTLIPIQVAQNSLSEEGVGIIAKAILYAIKSKADIINLSLGWKFQHDSTAVREMVKQAQAQGILVVVAAGNKSHSDLSYPCAYNDVICVGAFDKTGNIASYSNRGTQVDILAPGSQILSTWPSTKLRSRFFTQDNRFEYMSGTSQATPLVTGALAKLLNSGLTPSEARIKLLLGANKKSDNHDYRHGNINLSQSFKEEAKSFLYPINKAPYLIKWTKDSQKKFKFRIKNYGQAVTNINLTFESLNNAVKLSQNNFQIESLGTNEEGSLDIYFESPFNMDSEIKFKLKITTQDEEKEYIINAQTIRLLTPETTDSDFSEFTIKSKLKSAYKLRPFDNITHFETVDFLGVRSEGKKSYITVLKDNNGTYESSRELPVRESFPVFLNMSKVDLDLDNIPEYVVTYVYVNQEKDKITRFLIFDQNLKPKRHLIAPKNTFENDKTFLPGKFRWLPYENILVPTWIGYGENAQDLNTGPWTNFGAQKSNYIYILTKEGLKHIPLENKKEIPLHFLFAPKQDLRNAKAYFITSTGSGFFKEYFLYSYESTINKVAQINFQDDYFDLFEPRPLPSTTLNHNGIFQIPTLNGSMRTLHISFTGEQFEFDAEYLKNETTNESIKYILDQDSEDVIYQTNHKIIHYNRLTKERSERESKVDTRRRRIKTLLTVNGAYLPSLESPGYTSEIFTVRDNQLISSSLYRVFPTKGCEEIGLVQNNHKEFIAYQCVDSQKIFFFEINL